MLRRLADRHPELRVVTENWHALLPDADAVWAKVPGRLVLITCFVDDDGRTTDDNFVVFAES